MNRQTNLIATAIIIAAATFAVCSSWNDSLVVDEVPHIGAGYSYLTHQDMRLNPEHPPLAKDLSAIPLLFMNLHQEAFSTKFWNDDVNGQWEFGRKLIYNSGNDADAITRAARMPLLVLFILSAALVFIWGRELFGPLVGMMALILFAFSPTVLAHSRFVTTDMAALAGVLYATYFFIRWLKRPTPPHAAQAAIVFGLALLTKFSTILLVPFLGLIAVLWGASRSGMTFWSNARQAFRTAVAAVAVFATGFVLVVWPVYLFHTWHYPVERQHRDTTALLSSYGNRTLADTVVWMSDKPILRAAGQYGLGLLMVTQRAAGGNTTYFLGQVDNRGWWYYFPVVYFLKEPLAWWALVIIAIGALKHILYRAWGTSTQALSRWTRNHPEIMAMGLWLVIYWAASIKSILNIGVRHLLPTYPFAILLVSGGVNHAVQSIAQYHQRYFKAFALLIALLLGWYVFESVNVYPSYLAYFNQIALLRPSWATDGQAGWIPGGHNYVVDSNLDWGQDIKRLAQFVHDRGIRRIELDYFGWADQAYYLDDTFIWGSSGKYKSARDFLARNQSDGWIAVSATFYQGSIGNNPKEPNPVNYSWLKPYQPETVIGHSIFVWHITR